MKRAVAIACVILALLCTLWGCRTNARQEEELSGTAGIPKPTALPERTEPTGKQRVVIPEPTPMPRVEAEWYIKRNSELKAMLRRNGSFQNRRDIEKAVDRMYIDPDKPMVALTFDDGPVPGVTDKILDTLERYNVRATFFIVGARLKKAEPVELVKRAISLGCEIGNHTWAHEKLTNLSKGAQRDTIKRTNEKVYEETGYVMRDLRPPGGYSDEYVCSVAKELDMAVVKWAQSGNVMERDPEKIAQNVQKQIVNGKELDAGDIILLHDTKTWMVDAVNIIVPQLLDEGYQLVTVWELLNSSEQGFVPGTVYHHK